MSYPFEYFKINSNVRTMDLFQIKGMEDYYLSVSFHYPTKTWMGCVPIKSKYHGIDIPMEKDDVKDWVLKCYAELDPAKNAQWQNDQRLYWESKQANATKTKAVFEAINGTDVCTRWLCRDCGPAPACNAQPAARIRDLRQEGYYVATRRMDCPTCGKKTFFDLLIRLPRKAADNEKRFSISVALQKRIKSVLPLKDACFDSPQKASELIIDHKFPSSRWVNGETPNDPSMSDADIRRKFQLLTNQTNLQKERYCKRCVLKGVRGDFFGIKWYYSGSEFWEGTSKADENGCVGCPWYDLMKWKDEFNKYLAGGIR